MTVSDTVTLLSLPVSVGALFYAARSVNASRRATQLQIFDGIFRDIKRLDDEYMVEFKAKGLKPTVRWCQDFFNTLEYMAFLLNRKLILKKEMQDFYADAVIHWHKTFSESASRQALDDPDFFREFKKLHRELKRDGMR